MSNVEARLDRTLSIPDGGPLPIDRVARRTSATAWVRRRSVLAGLLFAGDIVCGVIAIVLASVIVDLLDPADHIDVAARLRTKAPTMLALLLGTCCLLGLYRPGPGSPMERFRLRVTAMLLFVFAGMLMWVPHGLLVELALVPLAGMIALVLGSWSERLVVARLGRSGAPAAILGTGTSSRMLARLLMSQPAWGLRPVAFIDDGVHDGDDANEPTLEIGGDDPVSQLPRLSMIEAPRVHGGLEIVVVPDHHALPRDPDVLYRWGARRILIVNQLGDLSSLGLQPRHFDRLFALELNGRPPASGRLQKRAMDLLVALPVALLVGPIVGLLALAIKIVDPGPAFYGQRRVGRYGKPIQVLKLRTMYQDAEQRLERVLESDAGMREQWRRYFKLPEDPRILPHIGNFLRRTSLDELPQLWNVIRGDMSLVGPRPFPAYHMNAFDPEFQALRVTVPPGLTGLWQISSRSSGDLGDQRAQDCFYIRNRSLWLDLYILVATLPAVIGGHGAK